MRLLVTVKANAFDIHHVHTQEKATDETDASCPVDGARIILEEATR